MKKTLVTRLLAILVCVATLATVTPIFAAAETTITEITITNADVTPYIGEKAGDWLDYTLPENCHFTMAKHYWYNETAESSMKADEVFAAGSKYDLCWRCEAESGYTFDAGTTVTINGSTTLLDDSFTEVSGDDPTVFVVWTKPTEAVENTVINKIEILDADVTPYIGEDAANYLDYTLPENCHYTVAQHYWYNETVGGSVKADEVFAAGSKYDLCWRCEAESGYTFDAGTTVTINGSTTLLDDSFTKVYGDDPTVFLVWTKPTEPVEKPAANVIDKIEILDADVTPYIGENIGDWLDYTLPENCHFTVDDHFWYNETDGKSLIATDTFEADISYEVGWWLDADEGYVFAENPTITINGQTDIDWEYTRRGDTVYTNAENKFFVWTKAAKAVENTVINKIEITDVDLLPIIGEKTNDHIDYTFSENCHFTAAEHGWYDKTDGTWVDGADDTFVAGHTYQVGWWLDADWGYTFAEDPTITINGEENINWEYTYIDEEDSMRFYVWTKPTEAVELTVIDKIEINGFCDPVVGGKVGDYFHLALPEDAPYHFDYSYWYNDTDDYGLSSGDTFEAGKFYSLGGGLNADEGYVFAEDPEVLFNGGEYPVDESCTERDDTDVSYFYVWGESKEAVEVTPAETVVDLRIGDKEFYGVKGGETFEVESLDVVEDITVLTQNGVDIEGMSEDWSMSTKFLDSEGRGVLEVQVFDEGDGYVTFNLQSHYADCPGAAVDDFQIMLITLKLPTGEKMLGDANDDGNVNMKDVLLMRKFLAGIDVTYNAQNADCNEDGTVNMKDVLQLRKYLAGLITELGA